PARPRLLRRGWPAAADAEHVGGRAAHEGRALPGAQPAAAPNAHPRGPRDVGRRRGRGAPARDHPDAASHARRGRRLGARGGAGAARHQGFIERLAARPGVRVKPGDALVVLGNQELASREAVAEARVRELRARYDAERPNDTVRMQIVEEELRYSVEELARVRQRLAGLILRANTEGTFIIPQPESLPGRFVKTGDLLAYVLDLQRVTVR